MKYSNVSFMVCPYRTPSCCTQEKILYWSFLKRYRSHDCFSFVKNDVCDIVAYHQIHPASLQLWCWHSSSPLTEGSTHLETVDLSWPPQLLLNCSWTWSLWKLSQLPDQLPFFRLCQHLQSFVTCWKSPLQLL